MLYTGFRELDDKLGSINNGELVIVADNALSNTFKQNILYNVARQIDKQNRQNIKNYDKKIKAFLAGENVKFGKPIEKVLVLGDAEMNFNVLAPFPRGKYEEKSLDLIQKQYLLFKHLPIEQSFTSCSWKSANTLIKDIERTLKEAVPTNIAVLCSFVDNPILKEVAQKLNIPVLVFTFLGSYMDFEDNFNEFKPKTSHADKLIFMQDNYWNAQNANTRYTTTFYVNNLKTGFVNTFVSKYHPDALVEFSNALPKYRLKHADSLNILRNMARNYNYINKYNFSKYLHLSSEKNKRFWVYIEVFKRTQIEDLYDLLAEYKKNVSKQEQMLAAEILHKLLVGDIKEKKAVTPTKNKIDLSSEDIQF